MSEASRIVQVTMPKYLKGAEDLTMRKRIVLALARKRGRMKYNETSTKCIWDIEFRQPDVSPYGDFGQLNFVPSDLYRQLELDWRGYTATDLCTEKEKLMNRGDVAIVDRYKRIIPTLMKALTDNFSSELLVDGNLANNENRIHGYASFQGIGTVAVGDRVAVPSDTYAGRSTALASESGTWSNDLTGTDIPNSTIATDWPDGQGSADYDATSPIRVNVTSTSWPSGTNSVANNIGDALAQTTIWHNRRCGNDGAIDMYTLGSRYWWHLRKYHEARYRGIMPHKESVDLGFPDTLNQDGVAMASDFDAPANEFFGWTFNKMQIGSLAPNLFWSKGPESSIERLAELFVVGFFGNLKFSPKYFPSGGNLAAA